MGGYWRCFWLVGLMIWVGSGPVVSGASGFNITKILWGYPEFVTFNNLLSATNVAKDVNNRTSLTILALANSVMDNFIGSYGGNLPMTQIQYVLQYHVILEYLDWYKLRHMPHGGVLETTLYQTTGKAPRNSGTVNITCEENEQVRIRTPSGSLTATVIGLVKAFPYTISIFSIDTVLIPSGFDLSTSSEPNNGSINVTNVLENAKNFNFVVSMMLASGVTSELESDQAGAGITFFAPTDDAFSALPPETLQGLTAENKATVLKYHALHSYYPLGSLESIVNPFTPTLATETMGAGRFTLNITRVNGSVTLNTGIVQASIIQTVFDQKPLAVFGVPKVLLPREMFGNKSPVPEKSPSPKALVPSPAPESSPRLAIPPSPPYAVPNPPFSSTPPVAVLPSAPPHSFYPPPGREAGEPDSFLSPSQSHETSSSSRANLAVDHIIFATQCIFLIYIGDHFLN